MTKSYNRRIYRLSGVHMNDTPEKLGEAAASFINALSARAMQVSLINLGSMGAAGATAAGTSKVYLDKGIVEEEGMPWYQKADILCGVSLHELGHHIWPPPDRRVQGRVSAKAGLPYYANRLFKMAVNLVDDIHNDEALAVLYPGARQCSSERLAYFANIGSADYNPQDILSIAYAVLAVAKVGMSTTDPDIQRLAAIARAGIGIDDAKKRCRIAAELTQAIIDFAKQPPEEPEDDGEGGTPGPGGEDEGEEGNEPGGEDEPGGAYEESEPGENEPEGTTPGEDDEGDEDGTGGAGSDEEGEEEGDEPGSGSDDEDDGSDADGSDADGGEEGEEDGDGLGEYPDRRGPLTDEELAEQLRDLPEELENALEPGSEREKLAVETEEPPPAEEEEIDSETGCQIVRNPQSLANPYGPRVKPHSHHGLLVDYVKQKAKFIRTAETALMTGFRRGRLQPRDAWKVGKRPAPFSRESVRDAPEINLFIVLDRSGSMDDWGKWDTAVQFGSIIADGLEKVAGTKVWVGAFDNAGLNKATLLVLREPGKEPVIDEYHFSPRGGTPTYEAVKAATEILEKQQSGTNVLILLDDGEPTGAYTVHHIREYIAAHRRVHYIEATIGSSYQCFEEAHRLSNAPTNADLYKLIALIMEEIRSEQRRQKAAY